MGSVEDKVDTCPMVVTNTGDPQKKCLLKNYSPCNCDDYLTCEFYLDYKKQNNKKE